MRLPLLLAALPALLFTACFSFTGSGENRYLAGYGEGRQHDWKSSPLPDDISYWDGDALKGPPMIKINLSQQKAFFYKGGSLAGVSRISTGKEGHGTRPGTFKVTERDIDHRSSSYGMFKEKGTNRIVNDDAEMPRDKIPPGCYYEGAPMFNFLRFDGGIGMHTGYLPGYSASHGCVRMPDGMAKKFFENAPLGTPVIVE